MMAASSNQKGQDATKNVLQVDEFEPESEPEENLDKDENEIVAMFAKCSMSVVHITTQVIFNVFLYHVLSEFSICLEYILIFKPFFQGIVVNVTQQKVQQKAQGVDEEMPFGLPDQGESREVIML